VTCRATFAAVVDPVKSFARVIAQGALVVAVAGSGLAWAPAAQAAPCPSEKVGGAPVGWIEFDGKRVPLKNLNYPAGGALDPPPSAQIGGVSTRHQPLLSSGGTTVIAWHYRFGPGCFGSMNPLVTKRVGSTFDIVSATGKKQTYKIVDRTTVPRGQYQPQWFSTSGAPRLSMFTCSDLRNGEFRKTSAIFAEPV
jgi:hypothetical protein